MLTFEWDANKAGANLVKHAASFQEATTVFGDPVSATIPATAHSQAENRFIILGKSHSGRILVVVHTERGDNIRIIPKCNRPLVTIQRPVFCPTQQPNQN